MLRKSLLLLTLTLAFMNTALAAEADKAIAAKDNSAAPANMLGAPAHAAPYKIAVLPVMDSSGAATSTIIEALTKRLARELHVPLNGVLQKVEVHGEQETLKELHSLPTEATAAKNCEVWLKALAEKMGVDLVLCLTVDSCYERTWMDWRGNTYYEAHAELTLRGWDNKSGTPIKRNESRWVRDDCGFNDGVNSLLQEAFERVLEKEKLRDRFFPTKKSK